MQSKRFSLIEQITRTIINYIISQISYHFLFPNLSLGRSALYGIYFVIVSMTTGYFIRRFFTTYLANK